MLLIHLVDVLSLDLETRMSKRRDQIRKRIKARAAEAEMSAEASVPKRVIKAIKLCGGRASASRVLDTVNKDRGRILSYNEVKGILEKPGLFKRMSSSNGVRSSIRRRAKSIWDVMPRRCSIWSPMHITSRSSAVIGLRKCT